MRRNTPLPSLPWLCLVVAVALLAGLSFGSSTVSGDEGEHNSANGQSSESPSSPSGADEGNSPPPERGM